MLFTVAWRSDYEVVIYITAVAKLKMNLMLDLAGWPALLAVGGCVPLAAPPQNGPTIMDAAV
jgi:hypothetical protein